MDKLNFTFVDREEFLPIFKELRPKIFFGNNDIDYSSYWSEEENQKFKHLQSMYKTEIRSYLLCKDEDKVVGWSFGFQKDGEEFYMVNSAVLPEYQRKGIYKKLLSMMISKAKTDGFQIVSSIHHATNNAVLVPKLKAGFKIIGMKAHARFGTLLELHYYTNEKVNKVLDYRTGYAKNIPD